MRSKGYLQSVVEPKRLDFVALIHEIHARGWSPGTGGNFSLLLHKEPLRLLITPSGVDKGRVSAAELLELDETGAVLVGDGKPSAEALLHVPILQEHHASVVVHTHSIWKTLASSLPGTEAGVLEISGYEMLKGLKGNSTHLMTEQIPVMENSQDIVSLSEHLRQILRKFPQCHAVLLRGHGLYTWGEDIFEARRHLEVLEFLFEVVYRQRHIGAL